MNEYYFGLKFGGGEFILSEFFIGSYENFAKIGFYHCAILYGQRHFSGTE
jgi:hypothetical protein